MQINYNSGITNMKCEVKRGGIVLVSKDFTADTVKGQSIRPERSMPPSM